MNVYINRNYKNPKLLVLVAANSKKRSMGMFNEWRKQRILFCFI